MYFNIFTIFNDKNDGKQLTQYLAAFSAIITVFTTGIYQGWSSPSVVKILSDEYPIEVTEEAGFLAAFASDRIGRKSAILGITIPQILSYSLTFLSYHNKIFLYIGRIFGGMIEGASLTLVPCYIAEIAEPNVRGTLSAFITVTNTSGKLFINTIGSFLTIQQAALVCLIFPIVFCFTFIAMPESPYYCLMKNDTEGAKVALRVLRRKQNVDKEVEQLSLDVQRQMSEKGTFTDLFKIASNRKAFLIVAAMRFFQVWCGMSAFAAYSQLMIAQTTDFSPVLGSNILLIANMATMLLFSCYIDRIGRRPMFIISSGLCFLTLYSQAIFLTIKDYTNVDVSSISWLPVLIISLFSIVYSIGLGPGVNVVIGEIFSTSIKAKAMSCCCLVFALVTISSTKLYQYTADNLDMVVPYYTYGTVTLIGTIFFVFLVPETKGKSLEMIQQELKGKENNDYV